MKKLAILACVLTSLSLFAQAAPVSMSSITVSGTSATVATGAAHGLAANQGVCLSAPSSMCGVVTAVGSATQFTATMAAAITACASACGTSAPAPQAIALGSPVQDQGHTTFTYALWLTSTQACPASANSSWKAGSGSAGASAAQLNAINSGLFVEKVKTATFPSNYPIANIQAFIQNDYTMEQQALATNVQPCQYYGFVYDSTGWAKQ